MQNDPPIGQAPSDDYLFGPTPAASEFLAEADKLADQITAAWRSVGLPGSRPMAQLAVDICAKNMAEVDLPRLRQGTDHGAG